MKKIVLFDLDGTIINTNELILETFMHVLKGITPIEYTREKLIPHMGRPLIDQFRNFTGKQVVDEYIQAYRDYNISRHDELVTEFPLVKETMSELQKAGVRMGIVTSKVRKTTHMGLKLCGLDGFVETIVTVEDVIDPKPHPEGILKALGELGANPEDAVMVGDSHYDIEAAHNAGVTSVAVAWSLKGMDYLKQYKPDHIIDTMPELLAIVGVERG